MIAESAPPALARGNLPALTALRFFAASYIVLFHFAWKLWDEAPWLKQTFQYGQVPVSFFFVLSGFLMAYNYLDPAGGKRLRGGARSFFVARFARIVPMFVVAWLAQLYFEMFLYEHSLTLEYLLEKGLPALFLLQAWLPDKETAFAWNGPGWTISVEIFFYLVFPLIALAISAKTSTRRLWILIGVTMAIKLALVVLVWALAPAEMAPGVTTESVYYHTSPLVRLPDFLLGVLLGTLALKAPRGDARRGVMAVLGCVVMVLALALFPDSWGVADSKFTNMVVPALLLPICGVIIYGFATGGGVAGCALSGRFFVMLGDISYALYILHSPIAHIAAKKDLRFWESLPLFGVLFAIMLAASALCFYAIEDPARRFLRRKLTRKEAPAAA